MDEAFSAQGMVLLAAGPRDPEFAKIPVGERFPLDGQSVAAMPFRTSRAARFRHLGMRTAVGPPIIVEGRLWGAAIVGLTHPGETLPPIRLRSRPYPTANRR